MNTDMMAGEKHLEKLQSILTFSYLKYHYAVFTFHRFNVFYWAIIVILLLAPMFHNLASGGPLKPIPQVFISTTGGLRFTLKFPSQYEYSLKSTKWYSQLDITVSPIPTSDK